MTGFLNDIQQYGGTIKSSELQKPRDYYSINKSLEDGNVLRVKKGVYMLSDSMASRMIDIERIVPEGVVCLYNAWDYYELTTQIPDGYYVAINKHRKVVVPEVTGIVLCYWEEKYCSMGVSEANIDGHTVKIFDIEKSVCDAIKFRGKIGTEVATEILKNYLAWKDRNVAKLMDYASKMRVLSTLKSYLEMSL